MSDARTQHSSLTKDSSEIGVAASPRTHTHTSVVGTSRSQATEACFLRSLPEVSLRVYSGGENNREELTDCSYNRQNLRPYFEMVEKSGVLTYVPRQIRYF